ncbi:uncharacterized protein [Prorops nasuta]|uniref:uncharacterized protein n=1 Tax=Prorops nasuta TaxID=863751 RepID=UPI0034CFAA1A
MDVIIKTGFPRITHDINFQPETFKKGKALFNAQHICNTEEHRMDGQSFLIQAQIIRQASVAATPYTTKLSVYKFQIDNNRYVTNVFCTCVYGQSKKCKHVAALIHYVNNNESLSKTDFEQQWGKPTTRQFAHEKYAKGKYFFEMFPSKSIININRKQYNNMDISKLKESSALRAILIESRKNAKHISEVIESDSQYFRRYSTKRSGASSKCQCSVRLKLTRSSPRHRLASFKHSARLIDEKVEEHIRPIYEELSNDDLMTRCLGGHTQNSNESFNSTVWHITPKHLNSGKKIVEIAAYMAAGMFNGGYSAVLHTMQLLNLKIGQQCKMFADNVDIQRIERERRRSSLSNKEARTARRLEQLQQNEFHEEAEGQLYGAGIAD